MDGALSRKEWKCCGENYPKQEIIYMIQAVLVYVVCIASIVNLSRGAEHYSLWISLLSSSVGYMMPNPTVKRQISGQSRSRQVDESCPTPTST